MAMLNGQALLATAMSGLTHTYSTLMNGSSASGKGLSLNDLSNLSTNTMLNLGGNYTFLQYLTNNFASVDQDGDGEISGEDLNKLMNNMQSKGMTYNEIQALCSSGNGDTTLLSTVLTYFNKIDKNGDGRITSDEITAFNYNCERDVVEQKYKSFKASRLSLYYNDGVEDDTSSVLDAMRPSLTNKNS